MSRWVLLRHTLPDASWHYDWLIEPAGASSRNSDGSLALICFRLHARPDDPRVHEFAAERLAPHRRMYLDYEGPVSGDRGTVSRVAHGTCVVLQDNEAEFCVQMNEPPARTWIGRVEPRIGYGFRSM